MKCQSKYAGTGGLAYLRVACKDAPETIPYAMERRPWSGTGEYHAGIRVRDQIVWPAGAVMTLVSVTVGAALEFLPFLSFAGTLWPFTANALPKEVSAPPPALLTSQRSLLSPACDA